MANAPAAQLAERRASHVGIHAIDKVVEQVVQLDRVAVGAANLETPLDDVAPAQHHLLLVIGQQRASLRGKSLDNGTTVRKSVLEREPVDGVHRSGLVQVAEVIRGIAQQHVQRLPEARALGERHELALQVPGPVEQIPDRSVARRVQATAEVVRGAISVTIVSPAMTRSPIPSRAMPQAVTEAVGGPP